MNKIRHEVFWPAFGLLSLALIFSIYDSKSFLEIVTYLNNLLLIKLGWLFSLSTLLMVFVCIAVWISPLGKVRIGGPDAKPLLNRWRWFAITLCTTIATGILFWGTAEPMYHYSNPPKSSGISGGTAEAAEFAMSTVYLHWTITPYAIYALPTIAFALAFYNRKAPFSLASMLFPLLKKQNGAVIPPKNLSSFVDVLCLFALVAGMSASLGTGILTLAGGLNSLFGIEKNHFLLLMICVVTVAAFVISASSGLMKGIRILSTINVYAFIAIALFIFFLGPIWDVISLSFNGILSFIGGFFEKNLYNIVHPEDDWANSWTVFFWANWMAWAPISAMFLGRISLGYTVREMLLFNWIIPALFSVVWMSIFSGTALSFQMDGSADLVGVLNDSGYESVIYEIMKHFPLKTFLPAFFILIVFLSYVTAADSNTEAMGGISIKNINAEQATPPIFIKVIWGICIGATAYIMVSAAGIEGIKMLSNLGGLPALILLSTVMVGMIWLVIKSYSKNSGTNLL
jgi:choline-glycine betaine transporter